MRIAACDCRSIESDSRRGCSPSVITYGTWGIPAWLSWHRASVRGARWEGDGVQSVEYSRVKELLN